MDSKNHKIVPIFIMGAPRSGTSLLASTLASRPDCIALPEMHYIHALLDILSNSTLTRDIVAQFLKEDFMFMDLEIASTLDEIQIIADPDVPSLVMNILSAYNDRYFQKTFAYWVEHTPYNHRYAPILLKLFPDSKFIHIVRDGRAVFNSTKQTDWGYKDVVTGARNWGSNVQSCLKIQNMFPDKVTTVKYEDLVKSPGSALDRLGDFVGFGFKKSMLEGRGLKKPSYARFTKGLGGEVNSESLAKWTEELSSYEISHFTAFNRGLLRKFEYDVESFKSKELNWTNKWIIRLIGYIKSTFYNRQAISRYHKVFENNS